MSHNQNRFTTSPRPFGPGKDKKNGLSIIILAARANYRMRSYGPPCLLKDKYGNTLLENQVQIFRQLLPESEIILVTGFESDKIYRNKPDGVRLVECPHFEQVNEVEEARLGLLNSMYDNALICFGNLYFYPPFLTPSKFDESFLIVEKDVRMLDDDVGITVVDNYITILSLALNRPKWCKTLFATGKELRLLKSFVFERNNAKLYLFEAINAALAKGGEFKARYVGSNSNIYHIDSSRELEKI